MRFMAFAALVWLGLGVPASAQTTDAEILKRGAGASSWLIESWTWTGPKPQPAAAPAKK